jgi:hypothetical protein
MCGRQSVVSLGKEKKKGLQKIILLSVLRMFPVRGGAVAFRFRSAAACGLCTRGPDGFTFLRDISDASAFRV